MKILHLLKTSTGAKWALHQIKELVRCGLEIHVVLPRSGPMVGKYQKGGAVEHYLQTDFPIREPWRFNALSQKISSIVKTVQPDIIHSHFVGTTLSTRIALRREINLPRIFQVPGPLHLEHPFFRKAEILTADSRDFWIGSCNWTCDRYRQLGIEPRRVFLSHYGTDMERLMIKSKGRLKDSISIGRSSKIVGMVAYMYSPKRYLGQKRGLKGHEDLIDAIRLCLKKGHDVFGVMVGGAWNGADAYERRIKRYAKKVCGDRIKFLGTRNDIVDLYADFDVAVHPSHSENVGGAIESLALGIPTIATNVGGFPDIVKDGETGWLVPPKSPLALSNAIHEALKQPDEGKRRAMKGQNIARILFDVKRTATEILSIYEKVLLATL